MSALRSIVSLATGLALIPVQSQSLTAQACPDGVVSEITYERLDPFGPEATSPDASLGWLFRGLNAIHIRTAPKVIAWELLFREGDCLDDPALLEESERSLRSLPYIVEATITSERIADGSHHVHVTTTDAWALSVGIAFTVDNGFQFTGLSFNARNLLGTGTQVGLFRNEWRERRRVGLLARQPNLFGTRVDATVHGGLTRSDNYVVQSLFRPYAGEAGSNAFRQSVVLMDEYFLYSVDPAAGFTQAYLRFEAEAYELTYQRRFGGDVGTRFIAGLGLSREEVRFPFGTDGMRVVLDDAFDDPRPAPATVQDEIGVHANDFAANRLNLTLGIRNLSFLNLVALDALAASQDVLDGTDLTLTVAPSFRGSGATVDDVLFRFQSRFGLLLGESYLSIAADAHARHVRSDDNGGLEGWRDLMYEIEGNAYWVQREDAQFYSRIEVSAGDRMDRPFQLTLGGREAVRGYDEDAYPAGRRLLMTFEQRLQMPALSTGFADIGVVAFFDAGRAWAGDAPFGETTGWKAGIGAGIRAGLPAGSPSVLRIEVGTPLTGERDTKGTTFRIYAELLGVLDRRSTPTEMERSRWYGIDPDLTTRPVNPLAGS